MPLRTSLRYSDTLRRARGQLSASEQVLSPLLVVGTFLGTGILLVLGSRLLDLRVSRSRLVALYLAVIFIVPPLLKPWWFWHWPQMKFWRAILGDRGARVVFIALGLVVLIFTFAPASWLAWLP